MTDRCTFRDCDREGWRTFVDHSVPGGKMALCLEHALRYMDATPYEGSPRDWSWKLLQTEKPAPCSRCAELEARLANFERETFAELRARVRELKEKLEWALKEIDEHNREYKYVTSEADTQRARALLSEPYKPSGILVFPEDAEPFANPTAGTYHWVDQDGKVWIRYSDGNVHPHPVMLQKSSDDEEK